MSALFVTVLIAGFAFLFLFRQRNLGFKTRWGGVLAILVGSCLVFFVMFYIFIEDVYYEGPDDWGAIDYARNAVDQKLGTSWSKVRIVRFHPSFTDAAYEMSYSATDGREGIVICHMDYQKGTFTSTEIEPSPPR